MNLANLQDLYAAAQRVARHTVGYVSATQVTVWLSNGYTEAQALEAALDVMNSRKAEAHSAYLNRALRIEMTRRGLAH